MNYEVFLKKHWVPLLLVAMLVYLVASPQGMQIMATVSEGTGYLSGTQGLEVEFNSLKYGGSNFPSGWYSSTEKPSVATPTVNNFGYSMDFDPDSPTAYMPAIGASEQVITLDSNIAPQIVGSGPWKVKNGTTTFANGTIADVYTQFEVWQYHCSWAFNLWLSGNEQEAQGLSSPWTPAQTYPFVPHFKNDYAGTTLWLKIVPKNPLFWTDNPEQVYFAPDYVVLRQNVDCVGTDGSGQITLNDRDISNTEQFNPRNQGEALGIYYSRDGDTTLTNSTILSYQGITLDPSIFRTEYWSRVSLGTFVPWNSYPYTVYHSWKFPSLRFQFDVFVYVVGEWTVYFKTGEVPALQPHTPQYGNTDWLSGFFNNPFNQLWILFVVGIVVVLVVSITSPGVWTVLASRKRRTEE